MLIRDIAFTIWRRLPVGLRQRASHNLLDAIRPRLRTESVQLITRIDTVRIVVGFLSSPSGLGQSARLTAKALSSEGYNVLGIDLSRYFFEVADLIHHDIPNGEKFLGRAHVIININAPYLPYVLWLLGRAFLKDKYLTGYWAWELPVLPGSWKRGFSCVHDIVTPSQFVADAIAASNPSRPIRVAAHPAALDLPPIANMVRNSKKPQQAFSRDIPFTIISTMSIASGYERKNPLALIEAFRLAFGERKDCCLRLLIGNAQHYPAGRRAIEEASAGMKNIDISWHELSRQAFWQWWGTPDVYASLHRSEGFGLPLAEAMCAGTPVVATGWSGNTDFMTPENSYPVDYQLIDVIDQQAKYPTECGQWAQADIDHAARIFAYLEREPKRCHEIGVRAQNSVRELFSARRFCTDLLDVIPENEKII